MAYFNGRTSSSGVRETPGGAPVATVTTRTDGHISEGVLHIKQELTFGGNRRERRTWELRKLGDHRYEGRANDIVGVAVGECYGNVFHWEFTLALSPGNPLANVRMSQWMYLQPDGRTLLNHSTITKLGVPVAQVSETFQRSR